jgi:hypothetical protein
MKYLGNPQSGSYAQMTASRNRNGQYFRTRAIPVNPNTYSQLVARTAMSASAKLWATLTDDQQAGWKSLGLLHTTTDSLGQTHHWNGFQAFCSVNNNLQAGGQATVTDAPALTSPVNIDSATLTLDGTHFSIAYTPTPLGADAQLFVYCSAQNSAGRTFNKQYKLIAVQPLASTSPVNILAAYTAIYGVPVAGYRIFVRLSVCEFGFHGAQFDVNQIVA